MEANPESKKVPRSPPMVEVNEALPPTNSDIQPSSIITTTSPTHQDAVAQSNPLGHPPPSTLPRGPYHQPYHQGAQFSFTQGYYQQLYSKPLPILAFTEGQYYPYALGQHFDPSQTYQYGGHIGYGNPMTSSGPAPQFSIGSQRPVQQGQHHAYKFPQIQYQHYPQSLIRPIPIETITLYPSVPGPPQFAQLTSPYFPFPQPYLPPTSIPQIFSDEGSSKPEHLMPHGPPRKPKQSGFALWVGNLPRDVLLEDLKEFFALEGLESIFLIRKSNCAFINYDTEEACSQALSIFNNKCIFISIYLTI